MEYSPVLRCEPLPNFSVLRYLLVFKTKHVSYLGLEISEMLYLRVDFVKQISEAGCCENLPLPLLPA